MGDEDCLCYWFSGSFSSRFVENKPMPILPVLHHLHMGTNGLAAAQWKHNSIHTISSFSFSATKHCHTQQFKYIHTSNMGRCEGWMEDRRWLVIVWLPLILILYSNTPLTSTICEDRDLTQQSWAAVFNSGRCCKIIEMFSQSLEASKL